MKINILKTQRHIWQGQIAAREKRGRALALESLHNSWYSDTLLLKKSMLQTKHTAVLLQRFYWSLYWRMKFTVYVNSLMQNTRLLFCFLNCTSVNFQMLEILERSLQILYLFIAFFNCFMNKNELCFRVAVKRFLYLLKMKNIQHFYLNYLIFSGKVWLFLFFLKKKNQLVLDAWPHWHYSY